MAIHITQIGKHKFICGLFWQSLSRPRELMKEAADLAKKIDADLMVLLRDNTTAQAGFAQTREGARRMVFSLAAAVSKTLMLEGVHSDGETRTVHDWLGAFKLPDGKWAYFAVRDGSFLPNGDFAGTKEEVMERLHGDYGLGGWNAVIGDAELEDYGFHNFNARRIEDLIPHKKNGQLRVHRWWGLRPVTLKFAPGPVIAVASLSLLLAAGGIVYWKQYQRQKEEEARDRAIEAMRQKMLGTAPAAPSRPWPAKPTPLAAARACFQKFTHVTAGGWSLDNYVCTANQVSYTWSRQGSTVDFLLAQVPSAVIDISGDKASYSAPLKLETGNDEPLLDYKKLVEPLLSRLQLLNLPLRIAQVQAPQPPGQANSGPRPEDGPRPEWQTFSFTLNAGGLPPTDIAALLNRPGVRLDRIAYQQGAWLLEGVMYAK